MRPHWRVRVRDFYFGPIYEMGEGREYSRAELDDYCAYMKGVLQGLNRL